MSFSATRLTCYALLSALEEDLRFEIESHISHDSLESVLGLERTASVQARRTKDVRGRPTENLAQLLPYLDFADSYGILLRNKTELATDLRAQIESFTQWLDRLAAVRNRVAHTRPMEIDDLANVLDVCRRLIDAPGARWANTRDTIARLEANPSFVLGLTIDLPTDVDSAPQNNLPVPDFDETGFFGRQQQVTRIKRAIKGAYPVVSILGDGGIGKTSIALKVAYELLDEPDPKFDVFVWVTAKATVLTANEILRINDAIQDSLGLFESAASELLSVREDTDALAEVLAYMEHFRVLLILDNLETVLDQRLRDFLLNLPLGSKVLVTSRIGLGIENPVQLEPMSRDEASSLLRAVARIRQVRQLQDLSQEAVAKLAQQMSGHPAYIKWFVAGVQSGKRPEQLLSDNQLLLEFCMSNVYEYLSDDARAVLRSMQTLAGLRGQAELAFINDFTASQIQSSLLELLTTNFVQMQSRTPAQPFDTTYVLTDFGRQYLDKTHAVPSDERAWLHNRDDQLKALGASLYAENSANPFDAETVEVRGIGDFHVAKLLRDAIRAAHDGQHDEALRGCREAQLLSPTFHEAWRVEAGVQDLRGDDSAALIAFDRAVELAPNSQTLSFFYGKYLLERCNNASAALPVLQRSAREDAANPAILLQIAWAHLSLGNYADCLSTADHLVTSYKMSAAEVDSAFVLGARAGLYLVRHLVDLQQYADALEIVEATMQLANATTHIDSNSEGLDRLLLLANTCSDIARRSEDRFLVSKAEEFSESLMQRVVAVDNRLAERQAARIRNIVRDKGYGFIRDNTGQDYFFHVRDLLNILDWDNMEAGFKVMMTPNRGHQRGPRAMSPRLVD
jgi:LuxR family glucitol operon transcriptional activator